MKRLHFCKRSVESAVLKRSVGSVLLLYAGFTLVAYVVSGRVIFNPHPSSYAESEDLIWIPGANGTKTAARFYYDPRAEYTVLFSHGSYGDLGDIDYDMKRLHNLGISILAYDYQGYGISPGKATVANACLDAEAALNYLNEQMGIPLDRIVLHGRSAGGGPTLYVASRYAVAGVILESTFTSAYRVVTRIPLLPFDRLRNVHEIRNIQSPVLVIHGMEDRRIPWDHGAALYRSAPEPRQYCWLPHSNHDVMPEADRRRYEQAICDFLSGLPAAD